MSRQFGADDGKTQYEQITQMWDNVLKNPPKDASSMAAFNKAKKEIQFFMNVAIFRCITQIDNALDTIERYSKSERYSKDSPHLFFSGSEPDKERIITAQKKIIETSLIPLKLFAKYAEDHGLTNQHQKECNRIVKEQDNKNRPEDTDNHQPSPTKKTI